MRVGHATRVLECTNDAFPQDHVEPPIVSLRESQVHHFPKRQARKCRLNLKRHEPGGRSRLFADLDPRRRWHRGVRRLRPGLLTTTACGSKHGRSHHDKGGEQKRRKRTSQGDRQVRQLQLLLGSTLRSTLTRDQSGETQSRGLGTCCYHTRAARGYKQNLSGSYIAPRALEAGTQ